MGTEDIATQQRRLRMSGTTDQAKGRIKKAAGELTDDKDLKRDGMLDEMAGKAKDAVDKAKEGVSKVKDKLTGN